MIEIISIKPCSVRYGMISFYLDGFFIYNYPCATIFTFLIVCVLLLILLLFFILLFFVVFIYNPYIYKSANTLTMCM